MMKKQFFQDTALLQKSLTTDLTPEEQIRLKELLQHPAMKKVYLELHDRRFLRKTWTDYASFSPKEGYMIFENRLRKKRLRRITEWSAVAAILLTGVISSVLLFRSPEQLLSHTQANIIPPGKSQATLTLGNGNRIAITDEQTTLLQQDGVTIRSEKGTLSYSIEKPTQKPVYHQLEIPNGGEFHFVLDDGTQVWLNSGTTLKYPAGMIGPERKLYLSGEAYFDVKKDGRRFLVQTETGTTEVLETEFGVTKYADEDYLTTTLSTGKIQFYSSTGDIINLSPGEQIIAYNDGQTLKQKVNIEEFTSWKDGLYVFRGKPLKEIMHTFERWYDIRVTYSNESISDIRFTGNVRRYDNINVFLEALSATKEVDYRIEGSTIELIAIR